MVDRNITVPSSSANADCSSFSTARKLVLRSREVQFITPAIQIKKETAIQNRKDVPELFEDDDIHISFNINDVVFGKSRGYQPWPAYVIDVKKVPNISKMKKKLSKKQFLKKCVVRVRFFGTYDELNVAGDLLYLFNEDTISIFKSNKFRSSILRRLFLTSIEEAQEFVQNNA